MKIEKEGNFIMMTKPSVAELLEKVDNRYLLVIATAKRARQIIAGDEPMNDKPTCPKPLSYAVEELYEGKVKIIPDATE